VQFLWSLLPGAREARNNVIVGYAWLAATALWVGVPTISTNGHAHELTRAIGHVGVGVAASFAAFMIGSLWDDLIGLVFRVRGARALTSGREGGLELIEQMGDFGRTEMERLEGRIDRAFAELTLRLSLILPLALAAASTQRAGIQWGWLGGAIATIAALLFQAYRRRRELDVDTRASFEIGNQAEGRLMRAQEREAHERDT